MRARRASAFEPGGEADAASAFTPTLSRLRFLRAGEGGAPPALAEPPGPHPRKATRKAWEREGVGRLVLACVLAAGVVAAAGCSPQRAIEATRVLDDVAAGEGPSALKEATAAPQRSLVTVPVAGGAIAADLYQPREGAQAGMILVPGVAPTGKDDRRLVAFANTIARAGFEVLVPDLARMRALQVSAADAPLLASAARWMAQRDPDRPLGMTAISFAAGPAVLALSDPDAQGELDFLLTVGGYYDLPSVITFFTTGAFRESKTEPWRYRTPNAYGKWVFLLSNAPRLERPEDRVALAAIARKKLDDPTADVTSRVGELGPDGRAVYALLMNRDPERVTSLIAALPAVVRDEIAALDLARGTLATAGTRFVLIHGRNDAIIPETESQAFARALPDEAAALYLLDSLDHVNPEPPGVIDTLKLFDAVYTLLAYRDGVGLDRRTAVEE